MNTKEIIIAEMATTLLELAWADYADEMHITFPKMNYRQSMPTPADWLLAEANERAEAIYDVIRRDWTQIAGYDIDPALVVLRHAPSDSKKFLEDWAFDAVMSAMGSGVFWEDSHAALTLKTLAGNTVEIEVKCDGEGLYGWAAEGDNQYINLTEEELDARDDL